jgi:hypothetical protein
MILLKSLIPLKLYNLLDIIDDNLQFKFIISIFLFSNNISLTTLHPSSCKLFANFYFYHFYLQN